VYNNGEDKSQFELPSPAPRQRSPSQVHPQVTPCFGGPSFVKRILRVKNNANTNSNKVFISISIFRVSSLSLAPSPTLKSHCKPSVSNKPQTRESRLQKPCVPHVVLRFIGKLFCACQLLSVCTQRAIPTLTVPSASPSWKA
jgi:hypothetical protein